MIFENGEFMPDQPALGNPGSTIAENCYPSPRGFRPFGQLVNISDAIDSTALGATSFTSDDGTSKVYSGNATKLYSMEAGAVEDRSGATYTNTATFWDFAAFGDQCIATNFADNPQEITMSAASGTNFADLTTDFKARTVAVVRDFVMFGNTNDATDGDVPNRLRWSSITDHTDYTISATTQSDYQDTPGGGIIQRVFGGEYATVLFENSIYRGNYVGSPNVWDFDQVVPEIGLWSIGAAAQHGHMVYLLDGSGFYAFDGNGVQPIGNERVDRFFWSDFDASYPERLSCAIDHDNKCVCWGYPSQINSSGKPNTILIFNFEINRWSYARVDHDILLPYLTSDFTLETLDSFQNDVDELDMSVDSRMLYEGSRILGIMDQDILTSNQGAPLTAVVESKEMQPAQGRRSHVSEVWPMNDGGTATVQIGTRDRQQDTYSWSDAVAVNDTGFAPVDAEGRYHRVRMNISGEWSESQGSDVTAKKRGRF